MKKRIVSVVLALIMVAAATVLGACGPSPAPIEEKTTAGELLSSKYSDAFSSDYLNITVNADYDINLPSYSKHNESINFTIKSDKSGDTENADVFAERIDKSNTDTPSEDDKTTSSAYIRGDYIYISDNMYFTDNDVLQGGYKYDETEYFLYNFIDGGLKDIIKLLKHNLTAEVALNASEYSFSGSYTDKINSVLTYISEISKKDAAFLKKFDEYTGETPLIPETSAYDVLGDIIEKIVAANGAAVENGYGVKFLDSIFESDDILYLSDIVEKIDELLQKATGDSETTLYKSIDEFFGNKTVGEIYDSLPLILKSVLADSYNSKLKGFSNKKVSEVLDSLVTASAYGLSIQDILGDLASAKENLTQITFTQLLEEYSDILGVIFKIFPNIDLSFSSADINAGLKLNGDNKISEISADFAFNFSIAAPSDDSDDIGASAEDNKKTTTYTNEISVKITFDYTKPILKDLSAEKISAFAVPAESLYNNITGSLFKNEKAITDASFIIYKSQKTDAISKIVIGSDLLDYYTAYKNEQMVTDSKNFTIEDKGSYYLITVKKDVLSKTDKIEIHIYTSLEQSYTSYSYYTVERNKLI